MALNVTGGTGLEFTASLDADSFDAGIKKVTNDLNQVTNEAAKSGEEFNKNFAQKLTSSFNDVSKSSGTGIKAIGGLTGELSSLINPTTLIASGLGAAAISIYKYATQSSEAAKAQKILNDVISGAAEDYGKTAGKIDLLKNKLNDLSIPLKERKDAAQEYNKIADKSNQIDLTQLNNLNAINPKIEAQIKLFKERSLARAAENVVAQKAEILFKAQLDFDTKFPELNQQTIEDLQKNAADAIEAAKKKIGVKGKIDVNELLNFADLPDSDLQQLAQKNDRFKLLLDDRTKNILSNVNRQLKAIDQYKKGTKAGGDGAAIYQNLIDQAQKDLDQTINIASGLIKPEGLTTKTTKKDPKEDSTNQILELRKSLLEEITKLQRDASQSGLTKEQSELDKINEKYDVAIKKLQDYNTKKDAFNKKNPNANVPGFNDADIAKLNAARNIELANTTDKQNAAKYIQSISLKKDSFDKFEEYQNQHLGIKANEIYKNELDGFTSYLDYINSEIKRITSLPQTVGTVNELAALEKTRLQTIQSEGEKTKAKAVQDYKNLLDVTKNYNSEKQTINESYDEKEKTLQANQSLFTIEDYNTRFRALKQGRKDDLQDLNDNLFYQTEAYRLMNTNVLSLSKEGAKKIIGELKDILKNGFSTDAITGLKVELTPEQKKAIQDVIKQFKELNQQLSTFAGLSQDDIKKIEDDAQMAADSFHKLGDAIAQTNEGLGDTFNSLGDVTQVLTDAFSAATKFASGDIVGGIKSTVDTIVGIFNIGAKSRESEQKAKADLAEYTNSVITGQIDYNELLRDQQRTQTNINELTNQELVARQKMLATQKEQAQADYDTLLNQIVSSGKQIVDEHTKKYGGVLGIGRKTKVVQDLAGISDSDFEALQQLSSAHKLDEGTEKWFQALKKVHDELNDINDATDEQAQQMAERATATTSDSIIDSILQGFEQGKKATRDFADNFEDIMRQSILNSFKYQALKIPLDKFYADFAAAAESGNTLNQSEIQQLQEEYNSIITNAGLQFDQLQKLTKANLSAASSTGNSLEGGIKSITESTAEILTGQFGGLRLTAFEQLQTMTESLSVLNKIEANTALIADTNALLRKFDQQGIRIK
jgi:hypothetical protein